MQEILIVIDDQGGILVETDEGEQQFATADEALSYVQSLLPVSDPEMMADPAESPEQAIWDEEAAARPGPELLA